MKEGMALFAELMSGKTPERVPVICNFTEHGARILGMSIEDYYASPARVAEGQLCLRERFGTDTLLAFHYSALDAEMLGCRHVIFAEDGPPNVGHMVLKTDDDILRFRAPVDLRDLPEMQRTCELISILKREADGRWPVLAVLTGSFSLPAILMGMDRWLEVLLTGSDRLRRQVLEQCCLFVREYHRQLQQAGADLIAYCNPIASASVLGLEFFRNLALPWILQDFADAGVPPNTVYFCGGTRIDSILSDLNQAPFPAYYLHPLDDLQVARQSVPEDCLLIGCVNDVRMVDQTREEIDREVVRILDAGRGPGFALGTLLLPYALSEERISWLIASAHQHGRREDA